MQKKILYIATVEITIFSFHIPYLKYFNDQGYEVHVACNGSKQIPYCHVKHNIPFSRSPYSPDNISAFFMLIKIMKENQFSLIHCHTPVAGVISRLAAVCAGKKNTKLLYTAHGFQFYKGGPIKDWIIYYPIEKVLARFTDVLITINEEDYKMALDKGFKAKRIEKINGIGVDIERFQKNYTPEEISQIRHDIGVSGDDFVLLYVAEINKNKNQIFLLDMMHELCKRISNVKLVLAGSDSLNGYLQRTVENNGLTGHVVFLGYRSDIPQLLAACDVAVSVSIREGLPVNILEAMASGKPVVVTSNRGHAELVQDGVNGFLIEQGDSEKFIERVAELYDNKMLYTSIGQQGPQTVLRFSLSNTMEQMGRIYNEG